MDLTEEQHKEVKQAYATLTKLYMRVKGYVIASEDLETLSEASEDETLAGQECLSVAAINELRNGFDHDNRVKAVLLLGDNSGAEKAKLGPYEYCVKNVNKAIGHVYRAGYDALEIVYLHESSEIVRLLDGFRMSTLATVMPDYAEAIHAKRDAARELHKKAKSFKDVESEKLLEEGQLGEGFSVHFDNYEKAVAILDALVQTLHGKLPVLQQVEEEKERDLEGQLRTARSQRNWALIGILATVVLAAIGILVTWAMR
ncbi:MAG: hypothetical protein JXQ73_11335 [Phycisphaerae bacterium]|nr:hypothetical protein [Phycisphaerae bacterium]